MKYHSGLARVADRFPGKVTEQHGNRTAAEKTECTRWAALRMPGLAMTSDMLPAPEWASSGGWGPGRSRRTGFVLRHRPRPPLVTAALQPAGEAPRPLAEFILPVPAGLALGMAGEGPRVAAGVPGDASPVGPGSCARSRGR